MRREGGGVAGGRVGIARTGEVNDLLYSVEKCLESRRLPGAAAGGGTAAAGSSAASVANETRGAAVAARRSAAAWAHLLGPGAGMIVPS